MGLKQASIFILVLLIIKSSSYAGSYKYMGLLVAYMCWWYWNAVITNYSIHD